MNIYRIEAYDSIILCEYFCIEVNDFMLRGKKFIYKLIFC